MQSPTLLIVQARAVLYMGYLQQPTVLELTVGPLPSPSNYTILREVPWNTRPPNMAEYAMWVTAAMLSLQLFAATQAKTALT